MVMKISLNGQFFLVVPMTLEFKDVFFFFGKTFTWHTHGHEDFSKKITNQQEMVKCWMIM
jgi:hypothetical protein